MEKPILFNTEMVQSILEGRKTTTRRIIKRTPSNDDPCGYGFWKELNEHDGRWYIKDYTHSPIWYTLEEYISKWSKYHIGDILYVRETWQESECFDYGIKEKYCYKANKKDEEFSKEFNIKWKPSIHMPKAAARIFLKVTDIRIERLQGLDYEEVIREGIKAGYDGWTSAFKNLWDSTLKKDQLKTYGFDSNPWVWVVEFERINHKEMGELS